MKIKHRLTLILQIIVSCSIFVPQLSDAGIVSRKYAWGKNTLKVCWLTPESFSVYVDQYTVQDDAGRVSQMKKYYKQKQVIREVIEQNYTLDSTGIQFTDWSECPNTLESLAQYDFLVKYYELKKDEHGIPGGSADIGNEDPSLIQKYNNFNLAWKQLAPNFKVPGRISFLIRTPDHERVVTKSDQIRMLALHEFGHASGLMHEDNHPDAALEHVTSRVSETITDDQLTSVYDSQSIMSYANQEKYDDQNNFFSKLVRGTLKFYKHFPAHLSKGDIHALRCLYLYSSDDKKSSCHGSFNPYDEQK